MIAGFFPRAHGLLQGTWAAARRWIDALWGYDVFIAHRRADTAEYAHTLYERLKAEKISCFIDTVVHGPGDSLVVATRRHVAKSSLLLLIGSPELLRPRVPVDWVKEEVETYLQTHEEDPKLIMLDMGGVVHERLLDPRVAQTPAYPILRHLLPFLRIAEPIEALGMSPSEVVLAAVRSKLDGRRREPDAASIFSGYRWLAGNTDCRFSCLWHPCVS